MAPDPTIPAGTLVTWGGRSGYVVAFVPAGKRATLAYRTLTAARVLRQLSPAPAPKVRDLAGVDRYLVLGLPEETEGSLRGEPPGPRRWYTPRAATVEKARA